MFKILEGGTAPTKASKYSAGIDLYAKEDITIGAGETVEVPLGVCIDIEMFVHEKVSQLPFDYVIRENVDGINDFLNSHYLELHPRSSLRAKGLIVGVGVIDLDYPDELMMIVHNPIQFESVMNFMRMERGQRALDAFDVSYSIKKGDKVAQILLKEHKGYLLGVESDEERKGGFGSSGG